MSKKVIGALWVLLVLSVICVAVTGVANPKEGDNKAPNLTPELSKLVSTYNLHVLSSIPPRIKPIPVKSIAELRAILVQFQKPVMVDPTSVGPKLEYYPGGGSGSSTLRWVTWTVKSRVFQVYFWGVDLWLSADAYYYPGQYFKSVYERVGLSGTAFPYSAELANPWHYHQIINQGTYVLVWGGGTLNVWFIYNGSFLIYTRPVSIGMGNPVPSQ